MSYCDLHTCQPLVITWYLTMTVKNGSCNNSAYSYPHVKRRKSMQYETTWWKHDRNSMACINHRNTINSNSNTATATATVTYHHQQQQQQQRTTRNKSRKKDQPLKSLTLQQQQQVLSCNRRPRSSSNSSSNCNNTRHSTINKTSRRHRCHRYSSLPISTRRSLLVPTHISAELLIRRIVAIVATDK